MNASATELTYRERLPEPYSYFALFESTGWNSTYAASESELESALRNSRHLVAAYDGNELVGFGCMVSDGSLHAMIYDLTLSSLRTRGAGLEQPSCACWLRSAGPPG